MRKSINSVLQNVGKGFPRKFSSSFPVSDAISVQAGSSGKPAAIIDGKLVGLVSSEESKLTVGAGVGADGLAAQDEMSLKKYDWSFGQDPSSKVANASADAAKKKNQKGPTN